MTDVHRHQERLNTNKSVQSTKEEKAGFLLRANEDAKAASRDPDVVEAFGEPTSTLAANDVMEMALDEHALVYYRDSVTGENRRILDFANSNTSFITFTAEVMEPEWGDGDFKGKAMLVFGFLVGELIKIDVLQIKESAEVLQIDDSAKVLQIDSSAAKDLAYEQMARQLFGWLSAKEEEKRKKDKRASEANSGATSSAPPHGDLPPIPPQT